MNENQQNHLAELKADIDEEFGTVATWHHQSGQSEPVTGIFSLVNKMLPAKSAGKNSGQLDIRNAHASFAMQPDAVPGIDGDRLLIDGENYLVLKFNRGTFETIIPLKRSQNKEHNWR